MTTLTTHQSLPLQTVNSNANRLLRITQSAAMMQLHSAYSQGNSMTAYHRTTTFNDVLLPFWAIVWTVIGIFPLALIMNYALERFGPAGLQDFYNGLLDSNPWLAFGMFFSAVVVYMLPIHIAFWRRAKERQIVFYFNFFLGWTGIAWLLALGLAFLDPYHYDG